MNPTALRNAERDKYVEAYKHKTYAMNTRKQQVRTLIEMGPCEGSYLDIGCGRGESLEMAFEAGYDKVIGTEVVPALIKPPSIVHAWGHELPFDNDEFDFVTCFDVLEHVLPSDEIRVLQEIRRVAKDRVAFTISNKSCVYQGVELHINRLPYVVWDSIIRHMFEDWAVARGRATCHGNESWECWR